MGGNDRRRNVRCKLLVIGIFIAISSFTLFAQTSGTIKGAGSGFIVDPEGYILTNYHVIEGAETITVYVDGRAYQPTIVATAEASDLALLKIPASGLTPVALGNSLLVQLLDPVVAMGYPLPQYGRDLSVSEGKITAIRTNVEGREGRDTLQHDAVITHGSSGGPLFSMKGEVIGVNFGGVEGSGLQFAIPINEAVPLLRNIPNFNPASMGTVTETLTSREIVARYSASVVYIEMEIEFSWLDFLPDPHSIPGFPNEDVEKPNVLPTFEGQTLEIWPPGSVGDVASRLKGLGFEIIGFAGLSSINKGNLGYENKIHLFAFATTQEVERALHVLLESTPFQGEGGTYWELVLGEGTAKVACLNAVYRIVAESAWSKLVIPGALGAGEPTEEPLYYVSIRGEMFFYAQTLLFHVHLQWSYLHNNPFNKYTYENGYVVEYEWGESPGRRLISGEEVARRFQKLANLVAITACNKLGG